MRLPDDKALEKIRKEYQLKLMLLHGSQATGQTHAKSDVDIAVLSADPKQSLDLLSLVADLGGDFGTDKIDVTQLDYADPLLLKTVTDKAQLLAGSRVDLMKLKLKAFHAYNDYLPYLDLESRFVRGQL